MQQHQDRSPKDAGSGSRRKEPYPDRFDPEQQKTDKDQIVDAGHQCIQLRNGGPGGQIGDSCQQKETDEQPGVSILFCHGADLLPANILLALIVTHFAILLAK